MQSFTDSTKPVYIGTSGGVDSSCLVVSLLDINIQPIIVSFTLDTHESSDFLAAKRLAKYFSLAFEPIYLPTDKAFICKSIIQNIQKYSTKNKADIECMYPIIYMLDYLENIGAEYFVMGHGADTYFCLSKRGMIHIRHSQVKLQKMRNNSSQYVFQRNAIYKAAKSRSIIYSDPFWSKGVFDFFYEKTWNEINQPRQKEVIRKAFPELDRLRLKNHTNFQLGDSGIADIIGETIRLEYSPNRKSCVSAYNYLFKTIKQVEAHK